MYGAILGDIIGSPYEFDQGDPLCVQSHGILSEKTFAASRAERSSNGMESSVKI